MKPLRWTDFAAFSCACFLLLTSGGCKAKSDQIQAAGKAPFVAARNIQARSVPVGADRFDGAKRKKQRPGIIDR